VRWSVLALVMLTWSTPAWADPKDDARRHFAAGLKAAQEGDYEIALQRFLAAQEAWPHPATLYNIAKAYTDLDDLPNALIYYRLYRDAAPEKAADVDPIVAVLEARLGQNQPTPVEPGPGTSAAGPTTEEIARLEAISQELQALSQALQTRSAEVPVPEPGTGSPEPQPAGEVLPAGEFLEEAYERVVVTASRVGQEPLDSPSTVTVLTAEDIRLSGVVTVPDLLRRVAGVEVMSPAAGHSDLAIRGFQRKINNKVLILVDGRSTYLDFLGTTFWGAIPIQLEEIERIEVIRGPGSAVYGANAVTGVINIITRTPGEGPQVVAVDYGTPGLVQASAVATGRTGATSYRFSGGYEAHGRWAKEVAVPDEGVPSSVQPFFDNENQALTSFKVNGRVDRTLGEQSAVSLSGGLARSTSEFYNIGALSNYGMQIDHHYLRGDLFWQALHLRSFWNANSGSTGPMLAYEGERDLSGLFDNDVVDVELEIPETFETGAVKHVFNAGAGWRYKGIRFSYLEGEFDKLWNEHHYQIYANEQATIGKLGMVASLRIDRHPLIPIDKTISPRGALLWRLFEKTALRATAGSAYRAPTAIESYMLFALPTPADGVYILDRGNRETLDPERITTFELGVHDESSYLHQADVVLYFNRVQGLIGLSDVELALEPFNQDYGGIEIGETGWINQEELYAGYGAEAELELFPTDGLDLFTNLSLSRIDQSLAGESSRDGSSSSVKVNAGASYRTPYRTDLSFAATYLSAQDWGLRTFDPDTLAIAVFPAPLDARLLASARVAVRPLPDEDLEIALNAWNIAGLMGRPFEEHPEGQPVSGRLYGTAAWRF
jgi:iron complex outermembrane receptor protein